MYAVRKGNRMVEMEVSEGIAKTYASVHVGYRVIGHTRLHCEQVRRARVKRGVTPNTSTGHEGRGARLKGVCARYIRYVRMR